MKYIQYPEKIKAKAIERKLNKYLSSARLPLFVKAKQVKPAPKEV
jgi:hypothetical protein